MASDHAKKWAKVIVRQATSGFIWRHHEEAVEESLGEMLNDALPDNVLAIKLQACSAIADRCVAEKQRDNARGWASRWKEYSKILRLLHEVTKVSVAADAQKPPVDDAGINGNKQYRELRNAAAVLSHEAMHVSLAGRAYICVDESAYTRMIELIMKGDNE